MKSENVELSLRSIGFIIQHPWLFIFPIILTMSLVGSYASSLPPIYMCKAAISVDVSETLSRPGVVYSRQEDLVSSITSTEAIRNVIGKVWPNLKESTNPVAYNKTIDALKSFLRVKTDPEDKRDIVYISYINRDPNLCYRVVKSTIEAVSESKKKKTESDVETGIAFLRKQLEFYKEKLDAIESELTHIKNDLRKKYVTMTDNEKYLIDELLSDRKFGIDMSAHVKIQKAISYDDKLTELNLQLLEMKKRKETMLENLKKGEIPTGPLTAPQIEQDTYIRSYDSAITSKELAINSFLAQGFMEGHPQIKNIKQEIENIRQLRQKRAEELTDFDSPSDSLKKITEKNYEKRIKDLNLKIESLEAKIETVNNQKESFEKTIKTGENIIGGTYDITQRYTMLQGEREFNRRYYIEIRQQLEMAELKNRIESENAGVKIAIIEEPRVPRVPLPSKRAKYYILGIMVGISLGVGLSYLADAFDRSVRSSADLRELLQIPVLASIDRINTIQDVRADKLRRNIIVISLITSMLTLPVITRLFMKVLSK